MILFPARSTLIFKVFERSKDLLLLIATRCIARLSSCIYKMLSPSHRTSREVLTLWRLVAMDGG